MNKFDDTIRTLFGSSASPNMASRVPLLKTDGSPAGSDTFAGLAAKFGNIFYGTCSTDATAQNKVATIANFVLGSNTCVAIRFASAINVNNATLNINGTGAKPIYYMGAALTQNVVRAGCIVMLQYDGTKFNIISIEGNEQSAAPSDLWVDMGLPSGVLWAKSNIDLTQPNGFAASPYQYYYSFFSWGNVQGYNPKKPPINDTTTTGDIYNAFDYSFSGENYNSSEGAKLTANITPPFDAARVNLGAPWRLPTKTEFVELFNNIQYLDGNGSVITSSNKITSYNSCNGIRLKSIINGNELFFPCGGGPSATTMYGRGLQSNYWTSDYSTTSKAYRLLINRTSVIPSNDGSRTYGTPIRPVI